MPKMKPAILQLVSCKPASVQPASFKPASFKLASVQPASFKLVIPCRNGNDMTLISASCRNCKCAKSGNGSGAIGSKPKPACWQCPKTTGSSKMTPFLGCLTATRSACRKRTAKISGKR